MLWIFNPYMAHVQQPKLTSPTVIMALSFIYLSWAKAWCHSGLRFVSTSLGFSRLCGVAFSLKVRDRTSQTTVWVIDTRLNDCVLLSSTSRLRKPNEVQILLKSKKKQSQPASHELRAYGKLRSASTSNVAGIQERLQISSINGNFTKALPLISQWYTAA